MVRGHGGRRRVRRVQNGNLHVQGRLRESGRHGEFRVQRNEAAPCELPGRRGLMLRPSRQGEDAHDSVCVSQRRSVHGRVGKREGNDTTAVTTATQNSWWRQQGERQGTAPPITAAGGAPRQWQACGRAGRRRARRRGCRGASSQACSFCPPSERKESECFACLQQHRRSGDERAMEGAAARAAERAQRRARQAGLRSARFGLLQRQAVWKSEHRGGVAQPPTGRWRGRSGISTR